MTELLQSIVVKKELEDKVLNSPVHEYFNPHL